MRPIPEFVISSPFLNIGCGQRFHAQWMNLDSSSTAPGVLPVDARHGLPFPDQAFQVVYSSHMLEHIPPGEVDRVLKEIFRVLKPGGIVRLAVPDLEAIARTYLECLEKALAGSDLWAKNYDWMVIELLDQLVRESPGGRMTEWMARTRGNEAFIFERCGLKPSAQERESPSSVPQRKWLVGIDRWMCRARRLPLLLRERLIRFVLGPKEYAQLRLGRFRTSGEVHRWMYDRFSLPRLLKEHGFSNPHVVHAAESAVPGWNEFRLDTNEDGSIYKPDSLFVEASRPA